MKPDTMERNKIEPGEIEPAKMERDRIERNKVEPEKIERKIALQHRGTAALQRRVKRPNHAGLGPRGRISVATRKRESEFRF
jgi:hypothetical protein